MAPPPYRIVAMIFAVIGLLLNIVEQILLRKKRKLPGSFTVLVAWLSYSDSFICLTTIGRIIAMFSLDLNANQKIFHSVTLAIVALGYLLNSTTIWLMSLERLLAIRMPLWHRRNIKKSKTFRMVTLLWAICSAIALVLVIVQYYMRLEFFIVLRILPALFAATFILLLIVYGLIFHEVRKRNRMNLPSSSGRSSSNSSQCNRKLRIRQQNNVLLLSFKIVISFLFCNAMYMIYANIEPTGTGPFLVSPPLGAAICLMVLVTSIDPLLYFFDTYQMRKCIPKRNTPSKEASSAETKL